MVLEFREYTKKIRKDTILELDFKVETGEILTIINNKTENLELLKDSFRKRTKFKGEILFDNEDVSKQQLLFTKDFGFYNDLNILFSILVDQNVLIIDNTDKDLTIEDMEVISDFILDKSNNANVIILDTMLNRYNSIADKVLVITDGIKSYYGNLEDLLILKQLTAINISSNENLESVLSEYQYTIYHENEIVVREDMLEEVVYSLLKNNIEVYQIRNLGEKIKLYEGEADL